MGKEQTVTSDLNDSAVTFVNVIELPAEQVDAFLAGWRERADFMRHQPGFRDYALHRAVLPDSRFQLINIAHWDSQEAFRSATADPAFRDQIQALSADPELDATANPGLYEVVHASAETHSP